MSPLLMEIETIPVEDYRDAGGNVFQTKGDRFASVRDPETPQASGLISIIKLAELIAARFR